MIIEMSGDTFGKNLLYLRKKYTLSRGALAKLVGMSPCILKGIETGINYPALPIESFHRICQVFAVDANDLATIDLELADSI